MGGSTAAVAAIESTRARIAERVVGRERELDLLLAAVSARRDILLEGPPGTSKSTLLRAIAAEWDIPLMLVEGNADLTPAKLLGYHSPSRVLREDYSAETFVDGPLLAAMRRGGFLYIEEFNRAPEDTLNTLLTAMAEREVTVPRVGLVKALASFRVIASMNPFDNVGTTRLSASVHDRMCRLAVGYQDEAAEREIVRRVATPDGPPFATEFVAQLRTDAVALTRATRAHPAIRHGSSVRGAIDLALVTGELIAMRGITGTGGEGRAGAEPGYDADAPLRHRYATTVYDAMVVSLSGRIHPDETAESTPEQLLREIWADYYLLDRAVAGPG